MGKRLEENQLRQVFADVAFQKMSVFEASKKHNLSFETIERIERYGKAGYSLAKEAKAKVCPKCGEVLDKKMRFCWKCGAKAKIGKDEIIEAAEKLLNVLTAYPCNQATEGIKIVNQIEDYINEQEE